MKQANIDLHVHSSMSDGTDTPEELVRFAKAKGLCAIALTDHDTVAGVRRAQCEGKRCGVEVVPGVELSAYDGREIHILGYGIQTEHPALTAFLQHMHESRLERVRAIVRNLSGNGFPISWEEVQPLAQHMVSRVHVAQILVKKGYMSTLREAFERLIGEGKPYYEPKRKISPQETIHAIHQAGGIAVLAHPYLLHCDENLEEVLAQLPGLDGIECQYPRHSWAQYKRYSSIAQGRGLLETGGSDYHGKNRPEVELGEGCQGQNISGDLLIKLKQRIKNGDEME